MQLYNPRSRECQFIVTAIFIVGLITITLVGLGAIVGACFAISYELAFVLNHLSSTQVLIMLILFYVLYRLCRYGWQVRKAVAQ